MEMESCVPPGFRFHPTEEELVGYYLKRKVNSLKFDIDVIIDIDVYRMEPWDIQERCRLGYEEQTEWYFFSHKDKKYPTGTKTNRATAAGFWKATGRDKAVLSKNRIIGMRKTLVFYKGRSPNGRKTDWIMHEYRLQTAEHAPPQEEGWVVCRAFKKPGPNHKPGFEAWNNHAYYVRDTGSKFRPPSCPDIVSPPMQVVYLNQGIAFPQSSFGSEQEQGLIMSNLQNQLIVELPHLDDSPSLSTTNGVMINKENEDERSNQLGSQYVDWKILDDLLSSHPAEADEPAGSLAYSEEDFPLISQEYELNAQNHATHIFTCQLPHL